MTSTNSDQSQLTGDPYASVRIPEYRNLIMGRFAFVVSLRMISTLVGWWIYQLTKDPLAIALVGLSEFVPAFFLALYSGHRVDVSDKKKLLVSGVVGYFTVALTLFFISTLKTGSPGDNRHIAWMIYGVFVFNGILRSFTGPAMTAMVAFVVPRNLLQNATTWNQGTWLAASVTGHATAGFLIALIGISGTLLVVSGFISIGFLFFTSLKPKPPQNRNTEQSTWQSVAEGLQFVFRTKALFAAMTLDMFAVLFGGVVAIIPVYATDILKIGPMGFGWLNAAVDIGAIISVISLTYFPLRRHQGRKMLLAVAGFGLCILVFGFSRFFWLSFAALAIGGMLDGISVVIRGTVMQLLTPDHMRGRVSSVSSMFIMSSNELGQFESGVAARLLGVVPSVIFGGLMTLTVVTGTWFKSPTLRKFEY
jgi:MFS family permease